MNIFNIALALSIGVLREYIQLRVILSPNHVPGLPYNTATGILGVMQSIFVDSIPLLRLIVVYPRRNVGLNPPRSSNVAHPSQSSADSQSQLVYQHSRRQLFDSTYASTLFLRKLWSRQAAHRISTDISIGLSRRLQTLF
ncbi:hypothetical protein FISHEDRAFT_71647 [Fistulina hepatica ATCC 64428]|uniref:Uncharacterized protein n=1 Tax=Fistulina hepatica ATCC 64428 TaxID=1128425 RepID=A0A0D7AHG7_9AGAR|nr:hypothetical protein FISHEDRAFT_71647 [Fistulina hepatica ATCC 64428]